jgi:TatD DNase family protein
MYSFLSDSHCHLNYPELNTNLKDTLANAKNNGVKLLQTIGTKLDELPTIIAIAEQNPNIFASIGIHPHETDSTLKQNSLYALKEKLEAHIKNQKVTGIGETGLDYHYNHSTKTNQIDSFLLHIELARENNLPLIIHTRNADEDTAQILTKEMKKNPFTAVLHCFTSSENLAKKALDLGFYISISGIITFKTASDLQKIVMNLPLENLLIETDSPYLAPNPYRGKPNQPAYLKETAKFIANLKNQSFETIQHHTTQNYLNLFSRVKLEE